MTHRLTNTKLYKTFTNMKQRCYNSNDPKFNYYGGKGITICQEWLDDFRSFYDWSLANGYEEGLTIDRVDSDGDYTPDNCRWVSFMINRMNRSKTILSDITVYTKPETVMKQERLKRGWTLEHTGKLVGVTKTAYRLIEIGARNPSYGILLKLMELFECSDPRELFKETN